MRVGHGIAIGAAFSIRLAWFGVALIVLLTAMGRCRPPGAALAT